MQRSMMRMLQWSSARVVIRECRKMRWDVARHGAACGRQRRRLQRFQPHRERR